MQINAVCPHCQNKYQLAHGLLGQKIRCPNPDCRQFFEVQEAPVERVKTVPSPKPARDRRAPSFDDDATGPVGAEPAAADWSAVPPPPVRRREPGSPAAAPTPAPAAAPAHPDEVLAWMMGPTAQSAPAAPAHEAHPAEHPAAHGPAHDYDPYHYHPPKKRRWMTVAIVALIFLIGGVGGGTLWFIKSARARQEKDWSTQAQKALDAKQYGQAAKQYDDLLKKFERSKNTPRYKFLKGFSETADAASGVSDPVDRRFKLSDYVSKTDNDETLKLMLDERRDEVYEIMLRVARDLATDAEQKQSRNDFVGARDAFKALGQAAGNLRQYATKKVKEPVPEELAKRISSLETGIQESERYATFLKQLDEMLEKSKLTAQRVSQAEEEAKRAKYLERGDVQRRLADAKANLREQIKWVEKAEQPGQIPAATELVSLLVGGTTRAPVAGERAVFAVARGILFALAENDGRLLWATRVGIDTNSLPLRIPKQGRFPEVVLVPTADGKGLVAREALNGTARWFQQLPAQIRGKPLLVERRVFVPLADENGTVVVLDGNEGAQEGYLPLGTRLGPGGATQEGTSLIFLPADSQSVFLLNANPPGGGGLALQQVLPTGHGAGTLRGEPVVVATGDDATGSGNLILCQSDGLSAMKVRSFSFRHPIQRLGDALEERLPGWSWFAPLCDQEKIALVTDTGAFALLGVNNQAEGGGDRPLFPIEVRTPPRGAALARGQAVHMEERKFWTLANGEMNMWQIGFDRKDGQKLAPGWRESELPSAKPLVLKLGSPLHAAQVSPDRDVLFLVTQTTSPPAWMATAVETETGKIRWKQPLGLAPQGDPIKMGEFVYQLDQGGGLYQIDPKQITIPKDSPWALGGQVVLSPRADVVGSPSLLLAADGKSADVVFTTGDGKQLQIRQVVPGSAVKEIPAPKLPAPMAGAPLLVGQTLVVPLANGSIYRLAIGSGKDGEIGPDWRSPTLGEGARGHVASLGGDVLLVTDGHRGLLAYKWSAGEPFSLKFQVSAQDRIVSAPLVIPQKDGPPRVVVADAGGRVTVYDGDPLTKTGSCDVRPSRIGNEVTAGPFLLEGVGDVPPRVLFVVDQTLLCCVDPDTPRTPKWRFKSKGDGIASAPRRRGDVLVLADLAGRFEAIDATNGASAGPAYPTGTLPAAPAAAPADLDTARLFAPLSDGTVLLIPWDKLVPKGN